MQTRTPLTVRQRFEIAIAIGCLLFLGGLALIGVSRWSQPERSDLKPIAGTILVLSHRETGEGDSFLDIDLTTADGTAHLSQNDYSGCYPALNGLKAGDTITALYKPDEMGRSIDWYWEIRKDDQPVLTYDQTLALERRSDRAVGEMGRWGTFVGAVLGVLALVGRQSVRARELERSPARAARFPSENVSAPEFLSSRAQDAAPPPALRRLVLKRQPRRKWHFWVVGGLPPLAIASGLAWVVALRFVGHPVTADVVSVSTHTLRNGAPSFRARLAIGERNSARYVSVGTDEELYRRFAPAPLGEGQHGVVTLRELTMGPLHGRMIEGHPSVAQSMLIRTGPIVLGLGMAMLGLLLWLARRGRKFWEAAMVTKGVVTAQAPIREDSRARAISYDYVDAMGVQHHGEGSTRESALWETMRPGKTVTVLYHPQKPQISMVYELSPFEMLDET